MNTKKPSSKRLIFAGITATFFIIMAVMVASGITADFDSYIYNTVISLKSDFFTSLATKISWLGSVKVMIILCVILLIIPFTRRKTAIPISLTLAFAAAVNVVLKLVFARARPDVLRLATETSYSFPSGHSNASAGLGAIVFILAVYYIKSKVALVPICILAVLFPILTGISRIYLGVHFASDVFAGWMLGTTSAIIVSYFWERYRYIQKENTEIKS